MVLDVNVLGAAVVDGILRQLDARYVVFRDHELGSSLVGSRYDLTQDTTNPLALLNRQPERNVFCLTC